MVHFSIDDFFDAFFKLPACADSSSAISSVFCIPEFAFLKKIHDEFDAVFSCYCFFENGEHTLADIPSCFRNELEQNSSWLRFGFHAINKDAVYGKDHGSLKNNRSLSDALSDYTRTVAELVRIAGSASLDRFPRIHFFSASEETCLAWKNLPEYGIIGLLSADDDRFSYYHDPAVHDLLLKKGFYRDEKNGLSFYRTEPRLEKSSLSPDPLSGIISSDVPDCSDSLGNLLFRLKEKAQEDFIIFTHACFLNDPVMKERIACCARTAFKAGYTFDFPAV